MTIRIAFVADSQVDERSRLAEHDRVMDFVVTDAASRGCTALVHVGDVYERRSTVVERASVRAWISMAEVHDLDVYIVGGNHEAQGEVEEIEWIAGAAETPQTWALPNGAFVLALPWPRRERLLSWLGRPASPIEADDVARDLLRDVIRGLWPGAAPPDTPRILAAHCMVDGSTLGPDQPPVGQGMRVGLDDLALAEADFIVLGHVHRPQEWTITRADGVVVPVVYCGSPRRTAYAKGELEPKGYVVAEFEGRRLVKWERVQTPATSMHLIEWRWTGTEFDASQPWTIPDRGSEVRLRYTVAADQRDAARARAEETAADWGARGAAEVVLDEVVEPTTSARCPEVALARTYADKLAAMWAARGETITDERRSRLLRRVAELEEIQTHG